MRILFAAAFALITVSLYAQRKPFSVYLIGDAGEDTSPGQALRLLREQIAADSNSAVVFLGDNAYPNGLRNKDSEAELNLLSQLQILKDYKGQAYFIPGNHDWDAQKRDGLEVLNAQEQYVNAFMKKNTGVSNATAFFPAGGFPGPASVMLQEDLRLIMIDTQWFLHAFRKSRRGSVKETQERFFYSLDSLLARAKENGERVIIAGHHPLYSNGRHSRGKQPWRFMINYTPFRIFGLMGLSRLYSQDMAQPAYRRMRERLLRSVHAYDNIVYACGHEHNLQCFREKKDYFIVSGAGSKLTRLRRKVSIPALFSDDKDLGYFRLTFREDGTMKLFVIRPGMPETEIGLQ